MKRTIRVVASSGTLYELDFEHFTQRSVVVLSDELVCFDVSRIRVHTKTGHGTTNFPVTRWEIKLAKVVRVAFGNFPFKSLPAAEVLAEYGVAKRLGIAGLVTEFDDLAMCPHCERTFPVRVSVY